MIVYIESNFVLELAYLRGEHECCTELLLLSEAGDIALALPAFSIGEPYEAWVRRSKKRERLHRELDEDFVSSLVQDLTKGPLMSFESLPAC